MNFETLKKLYSISLDLCITCKGCIYYTGIKCHGHGDYWGTCLLAYEIYKYADLNLCNSDYSYFDCVVYDNTNCILSKFNIFGDFNYEK